MTFEIVRWLHLCAICTAAQPCTSQVCVHNISSLSVPVCLEEAQLVQFQRVALNVQEAVSQSNAGSPRFMTVIEPAHHGHKS